MFKKFIITIIYALPIFASDSLLNVNEKYLSNLKQLTFGGLNAEAYYSQNGNQIIYQATKGNLKCDQIFIMDYDGKNEFLISTGKGRTTCGYFIPGTDRIVFSSTHFASDDCLPDADRSQGYVWAVFDEYDIYSIKTDGTDLQRLTSTIGYDAECTVSPNGKKIIFTSARDQDLELYEMNIDGTNQKRLTFTKGYDGGAFYSSDGKQIIYRAHHPSNIEDQKLGEELLKKELVKPSKMELFLMKNDGSNNRQLTFNGAANFAPFFTPDGKRVIFSSNVNDTTGYNFDLFIIDTTGNNLKQITFTNGFDGFPMISPDGKKIIFASSRGAKSRREINIFTADIKLNSKN
ncbi:MAG: hypothetical protein O3A55_00035 [Bacteroidetes bacterium]|nr:hypothetical protein [Bacteroidota bacterium]